MIYAAKLSSLAEAQNNRGENAMAWTTPTIVEVCAGFEVTAYAVAEM
jgi:coenzyme PQQ precursor peptide PqqA